LVNDSPRKITEGNIRRNNLDEFNRLSSAGNNKVKQRNAAGVIPDVANPILPQKSIAGESMKE
jgi:hypothetical protein